MPFNTFPRWITALSLALMLLLIGCATEAASGAPQQPPAEIPPTSTRAPTPTIRLRPTFTPIPTPDPTKQMADATEALEYLAGNAWMLTDFSTYAICQDKYNLDDARALDGKIYGFQFATGLSKGGQGEPFYDTPRWHRELRELARKLKYELRRISRWCK